jgi:acetoin:2,6-dichlorophenolindophenol oxidoreductase subunit beta
MPIKSFREAINEALRQEMERDSTVILIGEDRPATCLVC